MRATGRGNSRNGLRKSGILHLMLLPATVLTFIFAYVPLGGLVMAFQNFKPIPSFWGSKFVGLENFRYLFRMPGFASALGNTFIIAGAKIILSLVVPLTLALLFNELVGTRIKKVAQTSIFIPYFISWAILGGIILELFGYDGIINRVITALGGEAQLFTLSNTWFRPILIGTDIWKNMGYNMVVFLAAITNVDPSLYEVAEIDGAGYWKRLLNITLPGIAPFIVLTGIISMGNILVNAGFEQTLILYNPIVYKTGDIIDTFVYRIGMSNQQYSIAAAAGLFKSLVSFVFVSAAYYLSYKFSDYRIF